MGKINKNLRYPRLDTILMIEKLLQKNKSFKNKMQLWKKLPKKMMYQTFCTALSYLENSGKIELNDGEISWIEADGGMQIKKNYHFR